MSNKVTGEEPTIGKTAQFDFMLRKVHPVDITPELNVTTDDGLNNIVAFTLPTYSQLLDDDPKGSVGLKVHYSTFYINVT